MRIVGAPDNAPDAHLARLGEVVLDVLLSLV